MMKNSLLIIFSVALLSSCKKDYACFGSETIEYSLQDTSTNFQLYREVDFELFESCINCSRKDKENLLTMILEQLIRQEEKAKSDFIENGFEIKSENQIDGVLICEEKN